MNIVAELETEIKNIDTSISELRNEMTIAPAKVEALQTVRFRLDAMLDKVNE